MLDLRKYLSIGDKIQMHYIDAVGFLNKYVSKVVDIQDSGFIDTLIPIQKKRDIYLKEGAVLKLKAVKEEAIYEFKVVVYEKLFGRIPLLRLKVISDVNKIQRRSFYRLRIMRDIEVRLVEDINNKKFGEPLMCTLLDISSGGLLFSCRKEFKEKDMLEFTLDLRSSKLTVIGIILRRTVSEEKPYYSYGVKYVNLSAFDKDRITKYIYEEQRRLIKKGLI